MTSDLVPDPKFVSGTVVNFCQVIDLMAGQEFREYTVADLVELTGLSRTQLRKILNTGHETGWLVPRRSHIDGRTIRWALGEPLVHILRTYRVNLVERARKLSETMELAEQLESDLLGRLRGQV